MLNEKDLMELSKVELEALEQQFQKGMQKKMQEFKVAQVTMEHLRKEYLELEQNLKLVQKAKIMSLKYYNILQVVSKRVEGADKSYTALKFVVTAYIVKSDTTLQPIETIYSSELYKYTDRKTLLADVIKAINDYDVKRVVLKDGVKLNKQELQKYCDNIVSVDF